MAKYLFIFLIALISILSFVACNSDDTTTDQDMEEVDTSLAADIQLDVAYGDDPQQVYDLYLPEGRSSSKTKVIILVHGGGWTEGDKADVTEFIELIQQNNPDHAIVNINYKLATLGYPAFPNQFLDLDAVINQVSSQNETLQIIPEFGLIGVSAGAHISLQYDSVYDTDDQVKFVGDIVGPTDFTDPYYADDSNFNVALSFLVDESAYPAGTDLVVAVSPALQVNTNTSPSILFYGNTDDLVPLTNGDTLRDKLVATGVTNQYTIYDGGHGNWNASQFADVQEKLDLYINTYLAIE